MKNNNVALITGASSGIGKSFAIKLAQQGYDLIVTGRREDLLNELVEQVYSQYTIHAQALRIELSDDHDLDKLISLIKQTPNLHILINNAGYSGANLHYSDNYEEQEKMVKVHVIAPMKLVYSALSNMTERGEGIIINVSSLSSRVMGPSSVMYSSTKAFLQTFTEGVYMQQINSGIIMQTLCPGFTKTDFHEKIGLRSSDLKNKGFIHWMTPEEVVDISLKHLKKGRVVCVPGFWNKLLWNCSVLIPRPLYYKIASNFESIDAFLQEK
jgi:uncharacterized protein